MKGSNNYLNKLSKMAAKLIGKAGQSKLPPPPPPTHPVGESATTEPPPPPSPVNPGGASGGTAVGGSSWSGATEPSKPSSAKRSSEDFSAEVQGVTEQLYEDEALRRNLTDDAAQTLLDWGANWLTTTMPERYNSAKDDQQLDQTLEEGRQFVRDKIQEIAAQLQKNPSDNPVEQINAMLAN